MTFIPVAAVLMLVVVAFALWCKGDVRASVKIGFMSVFFDARERTSSDKAAPPTQPIE